MSMKSYHVLLFGFALLASSVMRADASTLYGSTAAGNPGELWILDPATGGAIKDVGPLNDSLGNNYEVTGLAFNPLNGVLYGSTAGHPGTKLLIITPATGLVTVVGSFNAGAGNTMADVSFDASGNL